MTLRTDMDALARALGDAAATALDRGLDVELRAELAETVARTPVRTGRLRASWRLVRRRQADGYVWTWANPTPYAYAVPGAAARLVREPIREAVDRAVPQIARAISAAKVHA